MTKFRGSMVLVCSFALLGWACSSTTPSDGNSGSGGANAGGSSGGKASGGSSGSTFGGSSGSGGVKSGGSSGSGAGGTAGSIGTSSGGSSGSGGSGGAPPDASGADDATPDTSGGGSDGPVSTGKLTITVDGTVDGDRLCFKPEASNSGGNKSPRIDWTGIPDGTKSLVLTMYDQSNSTPHRIVCNLSPTLTGQPANIGTTVPDGAQVSTGHSKPGNMWYGPGAGGNAHAYEIRIWALSTPTLEGGCGTSGGGPTNAVYSKLKNAPATLVLASDFKVLYGNVDGKCRP